MLCLSFHARIVLCIIVISNAVISTERSRPFMSFCIAGVNSYPIWITKSERFMIFFQSSLPLLTRHFFNTLDMLLFWHNTQFCNVVQKSIVLKKEKSVLNGPLF